MLEVGIHKILVLEICVHHLLNLFIVMCVYLIMKEHMFVVQLDVIQVT